MAIDLSRALGAYAAVTTLALGWLLLASATDDIARFRRVVVERIDVREPDGTLRLAIASHARMPGIIVGGRERPHPNRPEAGMIFYNDQGDENGGLVFDGGLKRGVPSNGGSFTFDRWHQDQTLQLTSTEQGQVREAAVRINDRPDAPMDFGATPRLLAMPPGPARDAAIRAANMNGTQRVYLGRDSAGEARLVLRDAAGRPRIVLAAPATGAASITLLDEAGRPSGSVR